MPQVTIDATDGGSFSAYLSLPKNVTGKVPGIVMMQQIFGANAEMRGFTDDYAAQGYVAICPDLFWRLEPGVEIDPLAPDGFQKAVNYAPRFNADQGVEDLKATVAFLRAHPACNGKIGTVGYCLGGLLAYLMAARSDADCNVGYFGVRIEKYLGEAGNVAQPLDAAHSGGRSACLARGAGANQSRARRPRGALFLSGGRSRVQPRRREKLQSGCNGAGRRSDGEFPTAGI